MADLRSAFHGVAANLGGLSPDYSALDYRAAGRPTGKAATRMANDISEATNLLASVESRYARLGHGEWTGGDSNRKPEPALKAMSSALRRAMDALNEADHHAALYAVMNNG